MKRDEYILMACIYALIIGLGFVWPLVQKQAINNRKEAGKKLNEIISAEDKAVDLAALNSVKKQNSYLESGLNRAVVNRGAFQERLTNRSVPIRGSKAPAGTALSNNAKGNNGSGKTHSANI